MPQLLLTRGCRRDLQNLRHHAFVVLTLSGPEPLDGLLASGGDGSDEVSEA
jgi:hypothetical protein